MFIKNAKITICLSPSNDSGFEALLVRNNLGAKHAFSVLDLSNRSGRANMPARQNRQNYEAGSNTVMFSLKKFLKLKY